MALNLTQHGQRVDPVAALRLRFSTPDASILIKTTGTRVQLEVVSAILEGAVGLLPPDNSVSGQQLRREIAGERQRRRAAAELPFIAHIRDVGIKFRDEAEHKRHIRTALNNGLQPIQSTPDILFPQPIALQGRQCRWIEYKDSFGFKKNPFVHAKNTKQFRRYVKDFGAGMVIYKLGFEENLLDTEGVSYAREAEALAWFQS